jgi:hypothetical protein
LGCEPKPAIKLAATAQVKQAKQVKPRQMVNPMGQTLREHLLVKLLSSHVATTYHTVKGTGGHTLVSRAQRNDLTLSGSPCSSVTCPGGVRCTCHPLHIRNAWTYLYDSQAAHVDMQSSLLHPVTSCGVTRAIHEHATMRRVNDAGSLPDCKWPPSWT